MRRPNFLIIQADQLAAQALPSYGNTVAKAPQITALADAGVVFEHPYCPSPLCSPSRFSMLAGQLPSRIGAYDNAAEFGASIPTFLHYLRRMGYRTCLSGKMHFVGPDQLHGFEERLTTDIYPADFTWTPDWRNPDRMLEWFHNMTSVVQAGVCAASMDLDFGEEAAFHAVRRIYSHVREPDERPLCMLVSFTQPHDPYVITREYWDRYRDDEIDMPAVPAMPYMELDPHSQRLWRMSALDEYAITDEDIRNARHGYYSAISYVDDKVGELIAALQAVGLYEDTIVVITSDHGDMLGERGLWYKMSMFDPSARVPLIFHAPAYFGARRVAEPVSLLDLLPTLVELAGGEPNPQWAAPIDGHSLARLLGGDGGRASDTVLAEYLAEGLSAPCVMIRRGPYKYIFCETDPEQLYDLSADPHELRNLASSPEHAEIREAFRAEVAQRWNLGALREHVLASQQRRYLVAAALQQGRHTSWDYQPRQDAAQQYVRTHMELWELMKRSRFPSVAPPAPQQAIVRDVSAALGEASQ
ncbi:MAG TPA: choline-sulfatase [Roseiflexaceae bacterium]|nr:choline-sulfatase [Roseiflexaceae bacterium]